MGKTVLLMLVLVALIAAPVSAQISGDAFPPGTALPREDDSLYRGAYEVTEGGDPLPEAGARGLVRHAIRRAEPSARPARQIEGLVMGR